MNRDELIEKALTASVQVGDRDGPWDDVPELLKEAK